MREWEELRRTFDGAGMFEKIRDLPEQMGEAADRFRRQAPHLPAGDWRSILFLGMGGSAIGGEIAATLLEPLSPIPARVMRSYSVPRWCGASTLVIATSYSGDTEETIRAVDEAAGRGATVLAVTSGGALAWWADQNGSPVALLPAGLPPRAAIGHLTVPILLFLHGLSLAPPWDESLGEARKKMEEMRERWSAARGPSDGQPARIASGLVGALPAVYHGSGEMTPVATRWCGQLAENGKMLAHRAAFPEACHNEIVGWAGPKELLSTVSLVLLRSAADHERTRRALEIASDQIRALPRTVLSVDAEGESPLARIFSTIYLGDMVSYFVALENGVDPTPVEPIDLLKDRMRRDPVPLPPGGGGGRRGK